MWKKLRKIQTTENKPSRRYKILVYHVPVNDEHVPVCSNGFNDTLEIGEKDTVQIEH
jgi:hypothetical protein